MEAWRRSEPGALQRLACQPRQSWDHTFQTPRTPVREIPMYDQSKLSELIRFARIDAGSTVIDVYPGDGDWTRLFSDIAGPEGRVYSFVPAEVAHFKNDPVGRMRTLAREPGRGNVEAVSADLVAMPAATQPGRCRVVAPVLP